MIGDLLEVLVLDVTQCKEIGQGEVFEVVIQLSASMKCLQLQAEIMLANRMLGLEAAPLEDRLHKLVSTKQLSSTKLGHKIVRSVYPHDHSVSVVFQNSRHRKIVVVRPMQGHL